MITERDKEILDVLVDKSGKIIPQRTRDGYLKKYGYYDYLINRYHDREDMTIREIVYRMYNDFEEIPKCQNCGNPVMYVWAKGEYSKWCSKKCQNSDPVMKAINAQKVSEYRKWEYANKKEEVQAKKAATLKAHYGEDNNGSPFCCKAVQDKSKQTCLEKYGALSYRISEEDKQKGKEKSYQRYKQMWAERGYDVDYTNNKTVIVHNGCPIHGDIELGIWDFNNRMKPERRAVSSICPECNPISAYSGKELVLASELDAIGIKYVQRDRTIIKPLELDFVIQDASLAIEFNGVYFHNEANKPNDYHINKTNLCVEDGYRLLHVWEDMFDARKDTVVNEIKRILKPEEFVHINLYTELYFKQIDRTSAFHYIENYSTDIITEDMLGRTAVIAAYDSEDEPVCIFVFKKEGNDITLVNFTQRCDVIVENHIQWFVEQIKPKVGEERNLVVKVCRDLHDTSVYEKLGFECVRFENTYRWVNYMTYWRPYDDIETIDDFGDDEVVTTYHKSGYYRCYDSGTATFRLKL